MSGSIVVLMIGATKGNTISSRGQDGRDQRQYRGDERDGGEDQADRTSAQLHRRAAARTTQKHEDANGSQENLWRLTTDDRDLRAHGRVRERRPNTTTRDRTSSEKPRGWGGQQSLPSIRQRFTTKSGPVNTTAGTTEPASAVSTRMVVRRRTKPRPRRSRAPNRQPGPTEAPRDRHAATRRAEKTISLRGPILVRWSPSACGLGVLAGWLHTFSYKMISARSTPDFAGEFS
eukprot:COSAG01_NODE_1940_length_8843_cov_65.051235_7_plen_232_part_00